MKALLRGFLAGFGFALGASVAGTLIGYTIGKIGERQLGKIFSALPATSSPSPSSAQPSSEPQAEKDAHKSHYGASLVGPLCVHGFVADGQACGEFGCTEPAPHNAGYGAGRDIFGKTVEEWRALKGTCRRCGSSEILQHPDGEYCGKCGYGTKDDRASISVAHNGMTATEAVLYRPNDHAYVRKEFVGHCIYEVAPGTICGWDEAHHSPDYVPRTVTIPLAPELVLPDDAPDDDEDDGSDYFRALDRHDDAGS